MATDDVRVRLYNKKILSLTEYKDKFMDFLLDQLRDENINMFPNDGVFDALVEVSATGNNMVNVAPGDAARGCTGNGHTIRLDAGDTRFQDVWIPPDAGVAYDIGIEQSDVDDGVEINPRTGEFEYSNLITLPGRLGVPDLVTDNGNGTITLRVNSITEAGKSYASRTVRVWLKSRADGGLGALTNDPAVAIEECTVAFGGGHNTITTVAKFGQGTVSTTAADYRVMIMGPTVKRRGAEDLRATSGCLFLAAITSVAASNPIVAIDDSDQNLIQLDLASAIQYGGGANWADGTPNPATTVEDQLDKIIDDLTAAGAGAAKISAGISSTWADGSGLAVSTVDDALEGIVQALGGNSGALKVGVSIAATWADATGIAGVTVDAALEEIVSDLASTSGAARIGAAVAALWADSSGIVGATVDAALEEIVGDLAATGGAARVGAAIAATWADSSGIAGATVDAALEEIVSDLGGTSGAARVGAAASGALAAGSVRSQLDELVAGQHNAFERMYSLIDASQVANMTWTGDRWLCAGGVGSLSLSLDFEIGQRITNVFVYYKRDSASTMVFSLERTFANGDAGSGIVAEEVSAGTGFANVDIGAAPSGGSLPYTYVATDSVYFRCSALLPDDEMLCLRVVYDKL